MGDGMTANRYIHHQPDSQPGFLQDEQSRGWGGALGQMKDTIVELADEGVLQRFVSECAEDALPYHGSERGLPRYDGDTVAVYRARLVAAPSIWDSGDTPGGLVAELNRAGFPNVRVIENWERPGYPPGHKPDGTLYAPNEEFWRFWVVFDDRSAQQFGAPTTWGSGTWGDGLWGFSRVPTNWTSVKGIIKTHKPAHTICAGIEIILSGRVWGDGVWGDGVWGGEAVFVQTGYH